MKILHNFLNFCNIFRNQNLNLKFSTWNQSYMYSMVIIHVSKMGSHHFLSVHSVQNQMPIYIDQTWQNLTWFVNLYSVGNVKIFKKSSSNFWSIIVNQQVLILSSNTCLSITIKEGIKFSFRIEMPNLQWANLAQPWPGLSICSMTSSLSQAISNIDRGSQICCRNTYKYHDNHGASAKFRLISRSGRANSPNCIPKVSCVKGTPHSRWYATLETGF